MGAGNYYFGSSVLDSKHSKDWHRMVYVEEYESEAEAGFYATDASILSDIRSALKISISEYVDVTEWSKYCHYQPHIGDASVIGQVGKMFVCAESTHNDQIAIIVTPIRKWHEYLGQAIHDSFEWADANMDDLAEYGAALSYICSGNLAKEMTDLFNQIIKILDEHLGLAEQMSFRATAWTSNSYAFYKQQQSA